MIGPSQGIPTPWCKTDCMTVSLYIVVFSPMESNLLKKLWEVYFLWALLSFWYSLKNFVSLQLLFDFSVYFPILGRKILYVFEKLSSFKRVQISFLSTDQFSARIWACCMAISPWCTQVSLDHSRDHYCHDIISFSHWSGVSWGSFWGAHGSPIIPRYPW